MIIKNGNIFTEDERFQKGQVYISDGLIEKIDLFNKCDTVEDEVVDAEEMYVLPGFVDIHFHGANGYDFCDATVDALAMLEEYQLKNGITTAVPSTMTLDERELRNIFATAGEYVKSHSKGVISGITMEGPFISVNKKGAQNELYIREPDIQFFEELQSLCGNLVRQVTVAPEKDENLDFISNVSKKVTVSLAHSEADYKTAKKAFDSGANHVTHLFNGMNPFLHRSPGIVGAALDTPDIFVEMICDNVHIHPSMVRAMFKLFGANRICMISDSVRAAGMPEGEYSLGGQKIFLQKDKAILEDGTIAGSVCNLYECFKKTVNQMHISLEDAVLSCTKTPAKSLGLDDEYGILKEDRWADILILDKKLNIKYVFKKGQLVYNS